MKPTKTKNTRTPTALGRSVDQKDTGLGFNGQDNGSSQGASDSKFDRNQHSGKQDANKTFNFGRGPTVGNTGETRGGPAKPPTSSLPNFKAAMGANDSLNFGKQERTPGGTRPFEPKAGQNYKGNADAINEGRGPTKGNQQGPAKWANCLLPQAIPMQ